MAKKKTSGASQHRRPKGKRLGAKVASGERVNAGAVLMRQHGSTFSAGKGVKLGRDFTLYSSLAGYVKFGKKQGKRVVAVIAK